MFDNIKQEEVLLIVGKDKISNFLVNTLNQKATNVSIIKDETLGIKKLFKLIFISKSVKKNILITLFFSELFRKNFKIPKLDAFKNKNDLEILLKIYNPKIIFVFRGSYIYPKDLLDKYEIINLHCADITNKNYRGLGSIYKSFKNKDPNPKITLHKVAPKIDEGKVILQCDYKFSFEKSYSFNENIAYNTGIDFISNLLSNIKN